MKNKKQTNDEFKNELLNKAKALIKAIDDNSWSLWENSLEYKPECVLWDKGEYEVDCDENDNWKYEKKEGIQKAYNELKNLIAINYKK